MIHTILAVESADAGSGIGALGINPSAYIISLVTFILVFLTLKRFAFGPITKILVDRRKTIDDGVKAGLEYAKERERLDKEHVRIVSEARSEADKIIATAHKEAREVIRDGEKTARHKAGLLVSDAEVRIQEETTRAKRALEKDIIGLVSEATEAIVGEKVDPKKDGEIIDKILKSRIQK